MSFVKKTIKKIVPQSAINCMQEKRQRCGLQALPAEEFFVQNLRAEAALLPGDIFKDQGLAASWEADSHEIADYVGHDALWGGVNPGDRRALYYLVRGLKPENVLEVGTHIGASTLYIARALKANGRGRLTTVDILDVNDTDHGPWKEFGLKAPPADNLRALGCDGLVSFVSADSIAYLNSTDERFDFIFLDGDHKAETVYREVAAALKCLNPGGTILLHDYYPQGKALFSNKVIIPGPYMALERIKRESSTVAVKPLGALPWPTKLGTNLTSLAFVGGVLGSCE